MKRFSIAAILSITSLFSLAAQSSVTMYVISGPTGIGMIRLIDKPPKIQGIELKTEALAQPDLVAARFISGGAVIGMLPANTAAKIAAAGRPVQVAAVINTGMLRLLSSDPGILKIEDLRGKNVEVAGQGATPDFVFRRILLSKGINPDRDLKLNYSLAIPEIAQTLIAGRVLTGLLPEPFATIAKSGRPELREIGDIQAEWALINKGENYPMTVLVVDAGFASRQRELLDAILLECRNSIEWVIANPAEAGLLAEKHKFGIRAAVAAVAIPKSNYAYIPAKEARPALEALYRTFLDLYPASIGGSMPKDSFYRR